MKTDRYTKIILTIIAVVLVINLVKSSFNRFATIPVNEDGTINVKFSGDSETLNVNLESIDRGAYRFVEPIEVSINK